jgi:hypothetical protein
MLTKNAELISWVALVAYGQHLKRIIDQEF